jgi:hypothetical protein
MESKLSTDKRCCGSGVCIINPQGECWCGQVWDGEKMCHPPLKMSEPSTNSSEQISKPDINNKNKK